MVASVVPLYTSYPETPTLSVDASQASETLSVVVPVERGFPGVVGASLSGSPGPPSPVSRVRFHLVSASLMGWKIELPESPVTQLLLPPECRPTALVPLTQAPPESPPSEQALVVDSPSITTLP